MFLKGSNYIIDNDRTNRGGEQDGASADYCIGNEAGKPGQKQVMKQIQFITIPGQPSDQFVYAIPMLWYFSGRQEKK